MIFNEIVMILNEVIIWIFGKSKFKDFGFEVSTNCKISNFDFPKTPKFRFPKKNSCLKYRFQDTKNLKKVDIELTFIQLDETSVFPEVIRAKFVRNQKQIVTQIILFTSDKNVNKSDIQLYKYNGAFIIKFSSTEKYSNTEADPYKFHKL